MNPQYPMMYQYPMAVGMPNANMGFPPQMANAPMMPGIAPAGMPGLVVPPQMVASQIYAGQPTCAVQSIPVNQQPACPDPARSLQLTKRVFTTVSSGLFVADNGDQLTAGFSLTQPGLVAGVPEPNAFSVRTDATTRGVIRDITIAVDPFALDYVSFGISVPEVINSFGQCFSALLSGRVTVDNVPFATIIPIASAIKSVGGIRSYWTVGSSVQRDLLYITPDMGSTHHHAPAPIEIQLPVSSDFGVFLNVPSRNIAPGTGGYTAIISGTAVAASFVWTGLITVLLEQNTQLGAVGIAG